MIQVLRNLYLGDVDDAARAGGLVVINVTDDVPFAQPRRKESLRVGVVDSNEPAVQKHMLRALPMVCRRIDAALAENKVVLVHCYAAVSRSCSLVAAYLMHRFDIPMDKAVRHVKSKRRRAFSDGPMRFRSALRAWEAKTVTFFVPPRERKPSNASKTKAARRPQKPTTGGRKQTARRA